MTHSLLVLYDENCGFCLRCARWLSEQRARVPLSCVPRGSPAVTKLVPTLTSVPDLPADELVVIDDQGAVWFGTDAWIVSLWATVDFRGWSERLASPTLRPFAREIFELVSHNRHAIASVLGWRSDDRVATYIRSQLDRDAHPRCADGRCGVAHG